jgi:amidase
VTPRERPAVTVTGPAVAAPAPGDLTALDATELRAALVAGDVSAREATRAHIARIEAVDGQVNAICTRTFERALVEADAADAAHARRDPLPVLHGLPIVHKDLLDTAGVRTTYGSAAFAHHVPDRDALIVSRTRNAGAIMLGKSNTPQFGTGGHTSNQLFGTTRNPWDLGRSAGGSSGGSAAALAAGMCSLATGTDMAGSLRIPASFCHVVGLRPSPGRIPFLPTDMQWFPYVTAGPMARTVRDLVLLLSAVAGPDRHAAISLDESMSDLPTQLDADVTAWRVAWAPDIAGLPVDAEVRAVLAGLPAVVASLGADVRESEPDLTDAEEAFLVWRAWYYATQYGDLLRNSPEVLDESTATNTRDGLRLTGEQLGRAEHARSALYRTVSGFFDDVDVLMVPGTPVAAFPADRWRPDTVAGQPMSSYLDWMRHLYLITATGLPALSLPVGLTPAGLPVGVQLVGPPRGDRRLLQFAHALEAALRPAS